MTTLGDDPPRCCYLGDEGDTPCPGSGKLVLPSGKDGDLVCPNCGATVDTGCWDSALQGLTEKVPEHSATRCPNDATLTVVDGDPREATYICERHRGVYAGNAFPLGSG